VSIHQPSGTHLLADMSGIDPAALSDSARIERLLREAAAAAGAQVLHSHFHGFGPGLGVTGVVLLAESHISIHTWPAADIFMCGAAQPHLALEAIEEALQPEYSEVRTVDREPPH
jgi:S-adenosylmethionine decarboxylase